MVTVIDYHLRENKAGKEFITLELQGDLEMVQSMETGRFYATARRCSITSTFKEETAKALVGTKMPGKIVRQTCDKYDYVVPETGEVIALQHSYQYTPDETATETTSAKKLVVMGV